MFIIILIIIKDHSITGEKYPFVLNVEELTPSIKITICKGQFLTNLNPPLNITSLLFDIKKIRM